jgi:hypothetical protein
MGGDFSKDLPCESIMKNGTQFHMANAAGVF